MVSSTGYHLEYHNVISKKKYQKLHLSSLINDHQISRVMYFQRSLWISVWSKVIPFLRRCNVEYPRKDTAVQPPLFRRSAVICTITEKCIKSLWISRYHIIIYGYSLCNEVSNIIMIILAIHLDIYHRYFQESKCGYSLEGQLWLLIKRTVAWSRRNL